MPRVPDGIANVPSVEPSALRRIANGPGFRDTEIRILPSICTLISLAAEQGVLLLHVG
ncbi:unannotated protein [freshwater metagenome]|uniref:Unannotated protein n=1 Tax=freshwater metagenome TaxID=449393 RepID=A0A6J6ZEG4_9ZZZZ